MKFTSDIDIDFADRSKILNLIQHIPASLVNTESKLAAHNTGLYVTDIPIDPISGRSALDYHQAESRGYIKLDFLNVKLYSLVENEQHLLKLMHNTPEWDKLYDRQFCEQLIHIGNHYETLLKFPEPVNSIPRMAMFLASIRPAKRHLIGKSWREVAETIWDKDASGYQFKKSHSHSYAYLVIVNMNLISQLGKLS